MKVATQKDFRRYFFLVVLLVAVLAGVHSSRDEWIKLGCLPANGQFPAGLVLNSCESDKIGDYSHDIMWYDLVPALDQSASKAKVLFFGDSRMLYAISRSDAGSWFSKMNLSYFMLAFEEGEQSGWATKLLKRLHARPSMLVFDTDPYFTGWESAPAQAIERDPQGELKAALSVKSFLDRSTRYCRLAKGLCGHTYATYRSVSDGHVVFPGVAPKTSYPIGPPPPTDTSSLKGYLQNAREVLASVNVPPRCVVFTLVPNDEQDGAVAQYLAAALGAHFILPTVPGLRTYDHRHLTPEGSKVWAAELLKELQPIAADCR